MKLNALIVEDEPVAARRLRRLIEAAPGRPFAEIRVCHDFEDAVSQMESSAADVLFLDLNLHGSDGFELLASAVSGRQQVIVVSANTDRALEAFDYGVLDFVPKPVVAERLHRALDRLKPDRPGRRCLRFLTFRHAGAVEVIPVTEVHAIHGAENYAEVELTGGRRLLHDKTLNDLSRLLPDAFERVHRSHILRIDTIRRLHNEPGSRYWAELADGRRVPVSRRRVRALRARLDHD